MAANKGTGGLESAAAHAEERTPGLAEVVDTLLTQSGARISGLKGTARAYMAAELHRAGRGVSVFVLPAPEALQTFRDTVAYFLSAQGVAAPVRIFPPWQVLPYDDASPPADTVGDRLQTLIALREGGELVVLTTWDALFHRTIHPARLAAATLSLRQGDELAPLTLARRLLAAGYTQAVQVEDPGEYSVRGGIVDVYPVGAEGPVRFDYFGDQIESVRRFDPASQVSLRAIDPGEVIVVPPARESFLVEGEAKAVESSLRDVAAAVELARPSLDAISEALQTRGTVPFQHFLLQQLVPHAWFTEFLPPDAKIWSIDQDPGLDVVEDLVHEAEVRYRQLLD